MVNASAVPPDSPFSVRVSAVVSAPDEPDVLESLLESLPSSIDEVVVVGGQSLMDSAQIAPSLKADVRVVERQGTEREDAFAAGFAAAAGEIVVMVDADSDLRDFARFVGALKKGAAFATDATPRTPELHH